MRFLFLLRMILGMVSSTWASSFVEQPFPDSVREASNIVRGKVGKSEAQWTTLPNGQKHLFTYYDLEVSEGLKGKARTGSIRIRELGGAKDGVSLRVSGTANFTPGEDVVVMLGESNKSGDGSFPVTGMMMGKYNIEKGADGKEYLRGPGLGGSLHPELRHEGTPAAGQTQIALEAVREIIRNQAAEPATGPSPVASVLPSDNGLFSSKSNAGKFGSASEEGLAKTEAGKKPAGRTSSPILFMIGAAIGVVWFLKSRKKKR